MDYDKLFGKSYDEYVSSLIQKYGPATKDYFSDASLKEKNDVSRTSEGLFCHHIDEDKAVLLSDADYILNTSHAPFEYQRADRLVYCDYLEHLYLHLKIIEKENKKHFNDRHRPECVGIGGFVFLVNNINEVLSYKGKYPANYREWQKKCAKRIEGRDEEFINAIKYFVEEIWSDEDFRDWYGYALPIEEMLELTRKIYETNYGHFDYSDPEDEGYTSYIVE